MITTHLYELDMSVTTKQKYKVGLCMAGAISGGAYTAGVIDYLIEALDTWEEKKKTSNLTSIPDHEIEIPIIGGASAGGITGVILASILNERINHVREVKNKNILENITSNKLYHSWVDLTNVNMLSRILDTKDLKRTKKLDSLINSDFIDEIADRAIKNCKNEVKRNYIPEDLKVFVTLTNLNGYDYKYSFKGNGKKSDDFYVTYHNDFACFKLAKDAQDYSNDGWIPLNFFKDTSLNLDLLKRATLATGAFPFGLKSRSVTRKGKYIIDNKWINQGAELGDIGKEEECENIIVDGGVINNEPFLHVEEVLKEKNNKEYVVLTIDPFPEETTHERTNKRRNREIRDIMGLAGPFLETLRHQAKVKPKIENETKNASALEKHYIISPKRGDYSGEKAIACGSLGGFGGFISKEFRIHDYFLGRANCQKFLKDYFTVDIQNEENALVKEGYETMPEEEKKKYRNEKGEYQIIPIFDFDEKEMYMPKFGNGNHFPSVSTFYLSSFRKEICKRIKAIMKLTIPSKITYNILKQFLPIDMVIDFLTKELSDWQLVDMHPNATEHTERKRIRDLRK